MCIKEHKWALKSVELDLILAQPLIDYVILGKLYTSLKIIFLIYKTGIILRYKLPHKVAAKLII